MGRYAFVRDDSWCDQKVGENKYCAIIRWLLIGTEALCQHLVSAIIIVPAGFSILHTSVATWCLKRISSGILFLPVFKIKSIRFLFFLSVNFWISFCLLTIIKWNSFVSLKTFLMKNMYFTKQKSWFRCDFERFSRKLRNFSWFSRSEEIRLKGSEALRHQKLQKWSNF